MQVEGRQLRADAARAVNRILAAAERVWAVNPAASLDRVAEEAGVSRTTVHRRFSSRDALSDALVAATAQQTLSAIEQARPESSPPTVALHQATVNMLAVKAEWRFAMRQLRPGHPTAAQTVTRIRTQVDGLLSRAQQAGLLDTRADLRWTERVYRALVDEANEDLRGGETAGELDALAVRVVETLLHGLGQRRVSDHEHSSTTSHAKE